MDWSERGNIQKRGPSWEPFRKNSALCSWQANQSWFRERRNPQAPNGSTWGNRKKHHVSVRNLVMFLTSSRSFFLKKYLGFTQGWTMGPSAAWFFKGQLRPHRNWKLDTKSSRRMVHMTELITEDLTLIRVWFPSYCSRMLLLTVVRFERRCSGCY